MSNNKRRTSRTKASSKNTDLYTPDTAPIVYDDSSTVTSVESVGVLHCCCRAWSDPGEEDRY